MPNFVGNKKPETGKCWSIYRALRREGHSKDSAAAIANSQCQKLATKRSRTSR